jgi:hypothetical protein
MPDVEYGRRTIEPPPYQLTGRHGQAEATCGRNAIGLHTGTTVATDGL